MSPSAPEYGLAEAGGAKGTGGIGIARARGLPQIAMSSVRARNGKVAGRVRAAATATGFFRFANPSLPLTESGPRPAGATISSGASPRTRSDGRA